MEHTEGFKIPVSVKVMVCGDECPHQVRASHAEAVAVEWETRATESERKYRSIENQSTELEKLYREYYSLLDVEYQRREQELLLREQELAKKEERCSMDVNQQLPMREDEPQNAAGSVPCAGRVRQEHNETSEESIIKTETQDGMQQVKDVNASIEQCSVERVYEGPRGKRKIDGPASGRPIKSMKFSNSN